MRGHWPRAGGGGATRAASARRPLARKRVAGTSKTPCKRKHTRQTQPKTTTTLRILNHQEVQALLNELELHYYTSPHRGAPPPPPRSELARVCAAALQQEPAWAWGPGGGGGGPHGGGAPQLGGMGPPAALQAPPPALQQQQQQQQQPGMQQQ